MAYSTDLRKRVLKYVQDSGSKAEAVNIFSVSLRTIWNWIARQKEGKIEPNIKTVTPRKIDDSRLMQYIKSNPDAYLREIAEEFCVTIPAVFYACKRLNITFKKSHLRTKKEVKKNGKLFKMN
tara:strand:+ start:90 stop:458 length:369 start_codon:yes stop_codon:yes gene_type:complete